MIPCPVKCGIMKVMKVMTMTMTMMKLFIHSQMDILLKFGNGSNYLSMLGLKLIHVSKRGPWRREIRCYTTPMFIWILPPFWRYIISYYIIHFAWILPFIIESFILKTPPHNASILTFQWWPMAVFFGAKSALTKTKWSKSLIFDNQFVLFP